MEAIRVPGVSVVGHEDSLAAEFKTLKDFASSVVLACAALRPRGQALPERFYQRLRRKSEYEAHACPNAQHEPR